MFYGTSYLNLAIDIRNMTMNGVNWKIPEGHFVILQNDSVSHGFESGVPCMNIDSKENDITYLAGDRGSHIWDNIWLSIVIISRKLSKEYSEVVFTFLIVLNSIITCVNVSMILCLMIEINVNDVELYRSTNFISPYM